MSNDEIKELIQLVLDSGIAELELQRGDNRVRIRKSFGGETEVVLPSANPAPVAAPSPALKAETPPAKSDPQLFYAKSPIVGTFYEAASPDTPRAWMARESSCPPALAGALGPLAGGGEARPE